MNAGPRARGFNHEPPAGGSPEWYTPAYIFERLGIDFDLDPCSPPPDHRPQHLMLWVAHHISLPRDGFSASWQGRVWLNPPYGAETARWIGKLAEHGDGVALVFARTDALWWQEAVRRASAVCFIGGRIPFIPGKGNPAKETGAAGASSCLLAFGAAGAAAVKRCDLGVVLALEASERRQLALAVR